MAEGPRASCCVVARTTSPASASPSPKPNHSGLGWYLSFVVPVAIPAVYLGRQFGWLLGAGFMVGMALVPLILVSARRVPFRLVALVYVVAAVVSVVWVVATVR